MTTKALIIPAAGVGSRMQKNTPKPFLQLENCTILEQTIRCFLPLDGLQQIFVATSESFLEKAESILGKMLPPQINGRCLVGGKTRQESIYNALQKVSETDLVIVHDAVRPFVKLQHIQKCCDTAEEYGGAVLGVPAKDTIKRIDDQQQIKETPSRKFLWQTQTPQIFQKALLVQAYNQAIQDDFVGTDDASLVERLGATVKMVKGDRSNFKITYPLDLQLAKLLIKKDG
ncbi:2-C-methyl-D-erythritol 4-phosphate cytidylyltransferase [Aliifodinibius salipaludis]|uniref:2-C-methyl-D-erythritol 4-phosphate cytidylyltransferase n=1 Tax=Fodinibius salipaludis TaxID=2032627 RepID=A0A2A2GAP1_9BACT|nr:2-C-methyl-D-erythritol 4-phosphate cytidylyltransferase [Aliifodinibius salipaludis]PAU94064.1 2-C-methyl-D-erythritol 4-phosphate cytidylyltransferase [Aliifodinibius salipaludis]